MKPTSKTFTASAATLFTFAFFAMTGPTVHADEYCITGGAQVAHGCGYPSMETCKAASAGIGGTCAAVSSSKNPSDALGYQPKQTHSRSERLRGEPTAHWLAGLRSECCGPRVWPPRPQQFGNNRCAADVADGPFVLVWRPPDASGLPQSAHIAIPARLVRLVSRTDVSPHSITSSARCWNCRDTSRPNAFAALRLITSWYFVGACTGRSPAFSPFRMRLT